jgi:hypothetical protein
MTAGERALFVALIGLSLGLGLAFVIAFGSPRRSANPSMAWLQVGLAWVAVAFDAVLLLSMFHIVVSLWLVAMILLAQDAVFAWRLGVLIQTRRKS